MNIKDLPQGSYKVISNPTNINQLPAGSFKVVGQQVEKPTEQKPSLGGFLGNVVSSASNVVGGIANTVLHPVKTIEGLGKVVAGGIESIPGVAQWYDKNATEKGRPILDSNRQAFSNLVNFYGQRYGGKNVQEVVNNIAKTAYKDPVGFALDLSVLAGGAENALAKAGEISKIEGLTKASQVAGRVSEITNPINQATKLTTGGAKLASKVVGKVGGEALGITTGAGYGAIKTAFSNGGKALLDAMRGTTTDDEIVNGAREALGAVKTARQTEYVSQLKTLKSSKTLLETTPISDEVGAQLKKYNITEKPVLNKKGQPTGKTTLDFSNSSIRFDKTAQADVNDIVESMKTLKPKEGVVNLDTLKQALYDKYSQSSNVRSFTTAVAKKTKEVLSKVDGYDTMSANYVEKTKFIDEVQKGLSLGNKASIDTTLRKLTSVLRQNNEFRLSLLKELEQYGGKDLVGQIAGQQLNPVAPRGLARQVASGEIVGGFLLDPHLLLGLAVASPRLVGEFVRALGLGTKGLKTISNYSNAMGITQLSQKLATAGAIINRK